METAFHTHISLTYPLTVLCNCRGEHLGTSGDKGGDRGLASRHSEEQPAGLSGQRAEDSGQGVLKRAWRAGFTPDSAG